MRHGSPAYYGPLRASWHLLLVIGTGYLTCMQPDPDRPGTFLPLYSKEMMSTLQAAYTANSSTESCLNEELWRSRQTN